MADETFQMIPYSELSAESKRLVDANAAAAGYSSGEEAYAARGGLNISGYYGDSYRTGITLTDAEYLAALQEAKLAGRSGSEIGAVINLASMNKEIQYYLNNPDAIPNKTLLEAYQSGQVGKTQFENMIRAGYANSTNAYKTLVAINNNNYQARPIGYTKDGKLFYGYDEKGNPILTPSNLSQSNVVSVLKNPDGSSTVTYSDGTTKNFLAGEPVPSVDGGAFGPGTKGYDERKSAYDLLYSQFSQYGLGGLVEPLKGLISEGISPSEFTIRLRDTDAYKKRFAANAQRIAKGLTALSEAEYLQLEDQYQSIMRNYGLPESYYTRGDMGVQQGFEKFIANDVSAAELEDRIITAQNRVINAAPEVSQALKQFYPDITNGDILAYALDPSQALSNIKRKVTAAEIGAGAMIAGLQTGLAKAEELQSYGVTGEQARQGYQTIGSFLPRATTLGDIYSKQGLGAYDQSTAESEVFGTPGAIEAEKKRRQLAQLEAASFSGSSGAAGTALSRERAGAF